MFTGFCFRVFSPPARHLLRECPNFLHRASFTAPSRRLLHCASFTSRAGAQLATMYLQCYINENGDKVYTTKKESPHGLATESAHPARFSPDDKYSRQRYLLKKRFGLLPTQKPPVKY